MKSFLLGGLLCAFVGCASPNPTTGPADTLVQPPASSTASLLVSDATPTIPESEPATPTVAPSATASPTTTPEAETDLMPTNQAERSYTSWTYTQLNQYRTLLIEFQSLLHAVRDDPMLYNDETWQFKMTNQLARLVNLSEVVEQREDVPEKYNEFHAEFVAVAEGFITAADSFKAALLNPSPTAEEVCDCAGLGEAIQNYASFLEKYVLGQEAQITS